ncbi:MAG: hypothetical protein RJB22_1225 [Pseudomonadota bacterium]
MQQISPAVRTFSVKRILVLASAAFALSACGEAEQAASQLQNLTDAAIDADGVANSVRDSVDTGSIEGAIKDAAAGALREELGVVGAVVDEDALVSGIDKAVDGKAVTRAAEQAARDALTATEEK